MKKKGTQQKIIRTFFFIIYTCKVLYWIMELYKKKDTIFWKLQNLLFLLKKIIQFFFQSSTTSKTEWNLIFLYKHLWRWWRRLVLIYCIIKMYKNRYRTQKGLHLNCVYIWSKKKEGEGVHLYNHKSPYYMLFNISFIYI